MKIQVKVKPKSKQSTLEECSDGSFIARLKSLPIDGKANQELIRLLAERFQVAKSQIKIKSGLTARNKLILINISE